MCESAGICVCAAAAFIRAKVWCILVCNYCKCVSGKVDMGVYVRINSYYQAQVKVIEDALPMLTSQS